MVMLDRVINNLENEAAAELLHVMAVLLVTDWTCGGPSFWRTHGSRLCVVVSLF